MPVVVTAAVDEHDAYWIMRHRVVGADWPPTEQLAADEETLIACWAWELGRGAAPPRFQPRRNG
jgi:hypothetical protein